MKANRRYTKKKNLEINEIEIPSNACTNIRVTHTIDARHIILAITSFVKYNGKGESSFPNLTRNDVENKVKLILKQDGYFRFHDALEYPDDARYPFENYTKHLDEAIKISKNLFPEFVGSWVPKSVKFVKKLNKEK